MSHTSCRERAGLINRIRYRVFSMGIDRDPLALARITTRRTREPARRASNGDVHVIAARLADNSPISIDTITFRRHPNRPRAC